MRSLEKGPFEGGPSVAIDQVVEPTPAPGTTVARALPWALTLALFAAGCADGLRIEPEARAASLDLAADGDDEDEDEDDDDVRCLPEIRHDAPMCRLVSRLERARRLQECAWILMEHGYGRAADRYVDYLDRELESGEILSKHRLGGGMGAGTGENYVITFKSGVKAIYKPLTGIHDPRKEVAVYRVDRLLGLNIVPLTVLRTIDGKVGSMQYFVVGAGNGWDDLFRSKGPKIMFFDALIANVDRHRGNWMFLYPGRLEDMTYRSDRRLAIDHNRAFQYDEMGDTLRRLPDGSGPAFLEVERAFYEGLSRVTEEDLTSALEDLVSPHQREQLLHARRRILRELCSRRRSLGCPG